MLPTPRSLTLPCLLPAASACRNSRTGIGPSPRLSFRTRRPEPVANEDQVEDVDRAVVVVIAGEAPVVLGDGRAAVVHRQLQFWF